MIKYGNGYKVDDIPDDWSFFPHIDGAYMDACDWCYENTKYLWTTGNQQARWKNGFYFENDEDAVAFKLRWT